MRIHWLRTRRYVFSMAAIVIVAIYPGHDEWDLPKSFDKVLIVRRRTGPSRITARKAQLAQCFSTLSASTLNTD